MNSLSPIFQPSDLIPLEVDKPQAETTPPDDDNSPDTDRQLRGTSVALPKSSDDSMQSLYDPEPIEYSGNHSLSPRGQMLFGRGVASLSAGEIDKALEIWRQARAEFPSHAAIAHNLGLAAGAAQQYDEAIAAFQAASVLDSDLIISNLNAVCISISLMRYQARLDENLKESERLREQGNYKEAEKVVSSLLESYPHSPAGLAELSLTLAYRSQNEPQKTDELLNQALKYAQRALFLEPALSSGFTALATAQRYLGAHREAFASARRALECSPHPDSSLKLSAGECALRASRIEQSDDELAGIAVEYANEVIAEEPDSIRAWKLRAHAHAQQFSSGIIGVEESLADFERLLQLDSTNSHAIEYRDFLLAQYHGNEATTAAKSTFREALKYLETNENEKALPLLQQILLAEPDSRPALGNLSLALRRLKKFGDALPVQTRLAELSSTPESWRLVAAIALQLKNYEQANKAYLQVAKLLPREARAQIDVATTFEELGRAAEAIPYWRRALELTPEDKAAWFHLGKDLLSVGCSQRPVDESLVCEAIPALDKAHALDGSNTDVLSQLAVGIAELGDSEMAFDYASRVALHDPTAHSALKPILTGIQSRRLSEGLASRSLSSELAPLLSPPALPALNQSEHLVTQSFTPIPTSSLPAWLVGLVGLLVIFGIWLALQRLGFGYDPRPPILPSPPVSVVVPPVWTPPVDNIQSSSSPEVAPPSGISSANSVFPFSVPMLGTWKGVLSGEPARLVINNLRGPKFYGVISLVGGASDGVKVKIDGTLGPNSISWSEAQIISNPRKINWLLGKEVGIMTQSDDGLLMQGTGSDAANNYAWSFIRDSESKQASGSASSPTDTVPSDWVRLDGKQSKFSLTYPARWVRSDKMRDGQGSISLSAPEPNVNMVVSVQPAGGSTLKRWQDADAQLRRESGPDYQSIFLSEYPLGGKAGAAWEFTLKRSNETQLHKIERGATYNGRDYTLVLVCPEADFAKWYARFYHIIYSFSFK